MRKRSLGTILILVNIFLLLFFYYLYKNNTIYVSTFGSDSNPGTLDKPFKSIQFASNHAKPGTTIKILPGIYREQVTVLNQGSLFFPITFYVAKQDRGKVTIVGSESSTHFTWSKCSLNTCNGLLPKVLNNVYFTKLNWDEIPSLIYEKNINGTVDELHLARTPNFLVTTDWKYYEHWWTAEESLEDKQTFIDKKLKSINDPTGATIYMIDGGTRCGQFLYTQKINQFDKNNGEIIFDKPIGFSIFGSQENGISKYTQYYIENKLELLDEPGEWYYDKSKKILYLWPTENGNPSNLTIEIGKRDVGFDLSHSSYINIDGLSFQFINENNETPLSRGAIIINPGINDHIKNISITNTTISFSSNGISMFAMNPSSSIHNITLSRNEIGNILRDAIAVYATINHPSNIDRITVSDSYIHHVGFKYSDLGIDFTRVSNLTINNNQINDMARYGIHIRSYEKNEGISENILIKDNTIENTSKAIIGASIKIYGGKYENTIIKNNVFRNNIGWTFCNEARNNKKGISHGLFISNASGIQVIGNKSYNNSASAFLVFPRQLEANNNSFINNLAANSDRGFDLTNPEGAFDYNLKAYTTRHDNTIIKNNIFEKNRIGIQLDPATPRKVSIDYNTYINNYDNMKYKNQILHNISNIHQYFPFWEPHSNDIN